ncbi:hypothetical protein D9M73_172640 [compost metagenome]
MTDQEWEDRGEHPAKVVAETHTGAAHVSGVQFVEQCPEAGWNACREESERESQEQHLGIGQWQEHIALHSDDTAQRKQHDVFTTANAVDQKSTDHTPAPEGEDDHRQVTTRVQHRKVTLSLEERRQPGHHRVVATVGTQAEQAAQQGHTQQFRAEDASHRLQEAGRDGLFLLQALEAVRLRHVAAYPNDQQRWQQTDEEHHPPGKLLRHQ